MYTLWRDLCLSGTGGASLRGGGQGAGEAESGRDLRGGLEVTLELLSECGCDVCVCLYSA